jgi:hypothetical protein
MTDLEKLKEEYSQSVEYLRSTSKWILSVFAAVAGVLVAGLQLYNLGKVESPYLAFSACAFFVALVAVLVIIGMTVRVLGTGTVTESILRDFAKKSTDIPLNDRLLLGGYSTVDEFLDKYKSLCKEYEKAEDDGNKKTAEQLKNEISGLDYHLTRLLLTARFAMVRKAFKQAIRGLFVCAAVAVMAIGVFAWATTQKPLTQLILQSPPSAASVTLTASGKKLLKDSFGEQCVQQASIPVIILSVQDGKFEVITTPSAKCRVSKFTISMDIGTVQSTQ